MSDYAFILGNKKIHMKKFIQRSECPSVVPVHDYGLCYRYSYFSIKRLLK